MAAPLTHMEMEKLSKDVSGVLKKYPYFRLIDDNKKLKCELSGHEMPCKSDILLSYVNGKKFKKLLADQKYGFEEYKDHIVPSKKKGRAHQFFCLLTWRHINKKPEHIKRHVEGQRFKKALIRWKECQATGEKFQANRSRPKQDAMDTDNTADLQNTDSEENESESEVDSLSDLYPAQDFPEMEVTVPDAKDKENIQSDSGSDFDFEEMEVQSSSSLPNSEKVTNKKESLKGQKRKSEEKFKKSKKKKK